VTSGICECGCGLATNVSDRTIARTGAVKGQPRRFIHGHNPARSCPGYTADPSTGCWNWNGYARPSDNRAGAKRRRDGSYVSAYRFYFERAKGPVPPGLVLDHTCRNPRCINPDHLEPVTQAVNLQRAAVSHASNGRFQKKAS
jgi:hypothetical protein